MDVGIEGVQKEKVDSKEKAQISAKRDVVAVGNGGMDAVFSATVWNFNLKFYSFIY